jgi:hypothetical protein
LTLYGLPNQPINQEIPEKIRNLSVYIRKTNKPFTIKEYNNLIFNRFRNSYKDLIDIEDTLFNYGGFYNLNICRSNK